MESKHEYENAKELYRMHVLDLGKRHEIWKSQWTKLLHPPPESFVFNLKVAVPYARLALSRDKDLEKARYYFVPSRISEYDFWRSYFWNLQRLFDQSFQSINWNDRSRFDLIMLSLKDIMLSKGMETLRCSNNKKNVKKSKGFAEVDKNPASEEKSSQAEFHVSNWIVNINFQDDEDTKIYAAPWELPPHCNKKYGYLQDSLLQQQAFAMSRLCEIWKTENSELVNPPPEEFFLGVSNAEEFAQVALELDENLKSAWEDLVPDKLSELQFWGAYFWNIELLKLEVTTELQRNGLDAEMFPLYSVEEDEQVENEQEDKVYNECKALARLLVLRHHTREKLSKLSQAGIQEGANENEPRRPRRVKFSV